MKSFYLNIHALLATILLFSIMQLSSLKASAQTSLVGKWKNSYGSILTIASQSPEGSLAGTYASSTGSTGVYHVQGQCFTNPENGNTALILLISWNSLDGSTRDPSQFWTSSMSGVFYPQTNSMELLNCISAPSPFSAVQIDEPGVYPETLVFKKQEGENRLSSRKTANEWHDQQLSDTSLKGEWKINPGNSSPYTALNISEVRRGEYFDVFSGQVTLTINGVSDRIGIKGLAAHEAPDYEQSVSLSLTAPISVSSDSQLYITGFSGLLNVDEQTLQLVITPSSPVDYENKYVAVSLDGSSYSKVK